MIGRGTITCPGVPAQGVSLMFRQSSTGMWLELICMVALCTGDGPLHSPVLHHIASMSIKGMLFQKVVDCIWGLCKMQGSLFFLLEARDDV